MLFVTPVPFLLWHARMSAPKKALSHIILLWWKNLMLAWCFSTTWNMSSTVHAPFIMRVTVFPRRIINLVQQMRQRRVITLFWMEWLSKSSLHYISLEKNVCSCYTDCWSILFRGFFAWVPHLCAEPWTPRVPQLSHWLFRLSVALFGLHNAAALQQGFPLPNSLRNVYLHTLTCWGGPRAWG